MEGATLPLLKGAGGEKHFDAEGGKSHRPRQIYRGWEEKDEEEEEGYRSTESSANPDPIIVPLIFFPLSLSFSSRIAKKKNDIEPFPRRSNESSSRSSSFDRDTSATLSLSVNFSFAQKISSGGKGRKKRRKKEKRRGRGAKNWRDHPIRRRYRVVLFPTSFLDLASRFIETRE